ncbi:MAG: GNAT family N-acetyltransferase [Candidatus Fimivicinus sp.]|nr:GNAT family N-acetyltransferase [Oscillospiraceae bacterium]MDY5591534.1 GNAT family N-acetyltransferase [Candidatus Fimivicinus sp.]
MNYLIREMQKHEYTLLNDFLYEAIFQRDENHLAPRTIINDSALQIYIKDFGTMKDDYCLCAEVEKKVVGAVWVRNIAGFGRVDDDTPEFAISLYPDFRGNGIGTELVKQMLRVLQRKGYKKASLAVQKDNYALRMYQKIGFKIIGENTEEFLMEYRF